MPKKIKNLFWITFGTLIVSGFLYLSSASMIAGSKKFNDPFFFVKDQFIKGFVIGTIAFLILYLIDLKFLKKFSFLFLMGNIFLLFLTRVPNLMLKNVTAARWVAFGNFGFQPSEFLKITLVMFAAYFLSKKSVIALNSWVKTIIPFWTIAFIPLFLVFLQPATSMVFLLICSIGAIFFSTKISIKNIFIIGLGGLIVLGAGIAITATKHEYRLERLTTFLNQKTGAHYHLDQAKTGIIRGRLWGLGFGNSIQKHSYLPESYTDSIYPVIAEEFGFVLGTFAILLIYFLICFLGLYVAFYSKDAFNSLFAIGTITWITVQAMMHIGCMSGLIPLTGVPLPLISYGGSDYVVTMMSMGVLYNIINKG